VPRPRLGLEPSGVYIVTLETNCGPIEIALDVGAAPKTTASFAYLVNLGFYNDLTFHNVEAGFDIQGGDPNGDGSGGPGYIVVERPPAHIKYTKGIVAMANSSKALPGTSGSQFFIVTAHDDPLPPQYALVGRVIAGYGVVKAISELPTDPSGDGMPNQPVVIREATISVG
jgi:cyclophilin family peptidyl-prolyl cis-trans isomerase